MSFCCPEVGADTRLALCECCAPFPLLLWDGCLPALGLFPYNSALLTTLPNSETLKVSRALFVWCSPLWYPVLWIPATFLLRLSASCPQLWENPRPYLNVLACRLSQGCKLRPFEDSLHLLPISQNSCTSLSAVQCPENHCFKYFVFWGRGYFRRDDPGPHLLHLRQQ